MGARARTKAFYAVMFFCFFVLRGRIKSDITFEIRVRLNYFSHVLDCIFFPREKKKMLRKEIEKQLTIHFGSTRLTITSLKKMYSLGSGITAQWHFVIHSCQATRKSL